MERQSSARGMGSSLGDAGSDVESREREGVGEALSRRKVFGRTVGVAVAGAAGGSVLAGVFASPARAAAQSTTVEQGAVAPAVVALTDAATIAVDASLGNDYRVTIAGNRTMGSPSNATNGQQIVFQVTQGAGGPYTITWGSSYGFSSGLPQPTLSTTAGQTDLLTFIYNTGMGMWLLAAFVKGFSSTSATPTPTPTSTATPTPTPTPTTTTTQPAGTYRLFPSTNGPSSATSYGGNFISGVQFCVTSEAWFQGYWWWVCPSGGQNTSPTKCALWQFPWGNGAPILVPGSVVTSGTLTAGQWNYIPLPIPIPLGLGGSPGMTPPISALGCSVYVAAIGCNGPFPDANSYWGAGQIAPNGITSGPLTAYSADGGGMPRPAGGHDGNQGCFATGGSDPSTTPPTNGSGTDNFWVDVQVSSTPPSGYSGSYRLWPSMPNLGGTVNNDTTQAVSGTAFALSRSCTLNKIWMWSPSGAVGFPTRVGIWNATTKTEVAGTDSSAPSWLQGGSAATAGSGWVYVDYSSSGVTLSAGMYMVAFFNGNGQKIYADFANYFFAGTDPKNGATVGGPGWNGISWGDGILTAPNLAHGPNLVYDDGSGTFPGQGAYQPGPTSWTYPGEFEASGDWGETRWIDVEVTPV